MGARLLTPEEVSPLVAMTARSVIRLANEERLPGIRTDEGWRFDPEVIAARKTKRCRQCRKERDLEHGYFAGAATKDGKSNTCKDCKRKNEAQRKLEKGEISPGHVESNRVGQQGMYLANTRAYNEARKHPRYCEVPGCGTKLAYDRTEKERRCGPCERAGRQIPEAEEDAA